MYEGGFVIFGDDSKAKIIGIGNVKIGTSPLIENIILVAVSYTHLTLPTIYSV